VQKGGDKKSDAGFPVNGHFHLDPPQTRAELEEKQKKINDPQNKDDGNPSDLHKTSGRKKLQVPDDRSQVMGKTSAAWCGV
jgi:hypothetical protein